MSELDHVKLLKTNLVKERRAVIYGPYPLPLSDVPMSVNRPILIEFLVNGSQLLKILPGVTRDRIYGKSEWLGKEFAVD